MSGQCPELQFGQAGVETARGKQLGVGALLHHAAVIHDDNAVSTQDRGQTVSDDQGGAGLHGFIQGGLDKAFVLGVQGAGGLVQQKDRRVAHQGAGDGETLSLAAGQ